MSSANPYGIFATGISGKHNLGYNALRGMTADRAERILAKAIAISSAQSGASPSVIEDDLRWKADNVNKWRGVTDAMRLASIALGEIESALTTRTSMSGAGEGFESASPIHDCRNGNEVAAHILATA